MAQIFRPASQIQRVLDQEEAQVKVFHVAHNPSSSLATIHTVPTEPQGCRDVVTLAIIKANSSTVAHPYTVSLFVQSLYTGISYKIAQGQLTAVSESWRPIKPNFSLPLEPGDQLQMSGTGTGSPATLLVDVYIAGIEHRPAS